ncbi:MAG: hypothetical protein JOZ19_09830 [Rubrobacter sp.]|nr:hypothetical protein [Rubrobacter sp.]
MNEIINGKRLVALSMTLEPAKVRAISPEFWLNGQPAVDLYRIINEKGVG